MLMILVAIFHKDGILTVFKIETEALSLEQSNDRIREENKRLTQEIALLRSDPYAIETIAREKLNLVRPDEKMYRILPLDPENSSSLGNN